MALKKGGASGCRREKDGFEFFAVPACKAEEEKLGVAVCHQMPKHLSPRAESFLRLQRTNLFCFAAFYLHQQQRTASPQRSASGFLQACPTALPLFT